MLGPSSIGPLLGCDRRGSGLSRISKDEAQVQPQTYRNLFSPLSILVFKLMSRWQERGNTYRDGNYPNQITAQILFVDAKRKERTRRRWSKGTSECRARLNVERPRRIHAGAMIRCKLNVSSVAPPPPKNTQMLREPCLPGRVHLGLRMKTLS